MSQGGKATILVADDAPQSRSLLGAMLTAAGYQVITARDGQEALRLVQEESPALVLLDTMMPQLSGFAVCAVLKGDDRLAHIPVILCAPLPQPQDRIAAAAVGCDVFLPSRVSQVELLTQVESLLRRGRRDQGRFVAVEDAVMALAQALEAKDPYSEGHLERVASFVVSLGQELGFSAEELELWRKGSILHDVGKIGVRDEILFKKGRLTTSEMDQVRAHPVIGEKICFPLRAPVILEMVRSHHERYDGRGYPDGLVGQAIPISARVMALVDAYDALTNDRPYRPRFSPQEAVGVLRQEAGRQFDPGLVPVFIWLVGKGRQWPLP